MPLALDDFDADRMKYIEREVVRTLLPYCENTEALLAVFALVRCARTLLRKYDKTAQKQMLPVLVAFLEGKTAPPGAESESRILLA